MASRYDGALAVGSISHGPISAGDSLVRARNGPIRDNVNHTAGCASRCRWRSPLPRIGGRQWWFSVYDAGRFLSLTDKGLRPICHYVAAMAAPWKVALVLPLLAAGCGGGSGKAPAADAPRAQTTGHGALPAQATRTVAIHMTDDLRFDPARIAVRRG